MPAWKPRHEKEGEEETEVEVGNRRRRTHRDTWHGRGVICPFVRSLTSGRRSKDEQLVVTAVDQPLD